MINKYLPIQNIPINDNITLDVPNNGKQTDKRSMPISNVFLLPKCSDRILDSGKAVMAPPAAVNNKKPS